MRVFGKLAPVAALVAALALAVAACDSAVERAEVHYQRSLALIAEGDEDRALVELRNVLRLDERHVPGRLAYARLLEDRGSTGEALGHYQQVVDYDRAHVEGHWKVAALALTGGDFETAVFHAGRAFVLAPDDPDVRAVKAIVDYRAGNEAEAVAMAEAVIAQVPQNVTAHMVLIVDRLAKGDAVGALSRADAATAAVPEDEGLHLMRLGTLERLGDQAAIGAQLVAMAERFPRNEGLRQALVAWHLRQGDPAAAEAVLRETAARTPDDAEAALAVVDFLSRAEGAEAARAEIDRLIEVEPGTIAFRRASAALDFSDGRQAEAIAELRAVVEGGPPSDTLRDLQVMLATMLNVTGDAAGRDALIAKVLEGDASHVDALKLRARAHVAADRPEAAIQDLRSALTQAPRDPEIMTILAFAHEREGSRELMGERLALAVETSGRGPEESLRYAHFLMQDGRLGPAEALIVDALRQAPGDPDLLATLGQIHLARRDFARVSQVAGLLAATGNPAAAGAATELELASLEAQGRLDETAALLEGVAGQGGGTAARVRLVQVHLAEGELEAAKAQVEALLAEEPGNRAGRLMRAGLLAFEGETAEAEALYRTLIAEAPEEAPAYAALASLLSGGGRDSEVLETLDAGLAATGGEWDLMLVKAGVLEAAGDFEGAIGVYEELYTRDSGDLVIANNLASLIASYRADPASLERAFQIARRLQSFRVPQFQDTYGWILARRGNPEAALAYLEPAAAALAEDPLVQVHLGMAYDAAGRPEEARQALARAVALAGEASELPPIVEARARLAALETSGRAVTPAAAGD